MVPIHGQLKRHVLVVSDGKDFAKFMSILLVRMGLQVISAENGDDTLRLAKLFRPDVMAFDMDAPALSGTETLSRIKQDSPLAEVPAIIINGANGSLKKAARSLGYTRHLDKPVNIGELHKAIQSCLIKPQGWARKHLRTHYGARVTVIHEGVERAYQAETISERGIFVEAPAPLAKGAEVKVTMRVGGTVISPSGRVIYTKTPGMAIEFSEIGQDEQAELNNFISNLLAGDIAPLQEARA